MCRMQSSCRPGLRIKCAAEVKSSETKQAGAASNGKADKEPEYYEVGLTPPVIDDRSTDCPCTHCTCAKYLKANTVLQVTLQKPLGIRFSRGGDGGAYVVRTDPKIGNTDPQVEVYQHCFLKILQSVAQKPQRASVPFANAGWHASASQSRKSSVQGSFFCKKLYVFPMGTALHGITC